MATRHKLNHDAKTRERIQTTQIVKRLMEHIVAKPEVEEGQVIVKDLMTQSQVTAALGLLKKTLPDLSQVSGEINLNQKVEVTVKEQIDFNAIKEKRKEINVH